MRRRTLLGAAGALAVPLFTREAVGAASSTPEIPARKLDRLALSSSTHRGNYDGRQSVEGATPRLSHLTLPRFARETFGLRKIELWDQQFGPQGHTVEQCRLIRAAADAAGVSIINVEVEDMPPLDQPDRAATMAAFKDWLDKGRILGCGSIRVNVNRGQAPQTNVPAVIEVLRAAADYGQTVGVRVLLENHGGYTASLPNMLELVKAVNHDFCRIELDWGAWTPPGDRYADMQAVMPMVHIVSAKGVTFDEATYQHTSFDVARLVRNAEAGGFTGVYSIELYGTPAPKDTDRAVRSYMKLIADNMR
jgi:sugar phosphate isomerase/epimerase